MGLSIHYSGSFNPEKPMNEMIGEIEDIAKVFKWNFHLFERNFRGTFSDEPIDELIYGISVSPPDCEPVWFTFLSNRRMSNPVNLRLFYNSPKEEERKYVYMLSTKTQYAGIKVHAAIIQLFRYISEKYFNRFEMLDEGKYWETSDIKILEETFARYTSLIDTFGDALNHVPRKENESIEAFIGRIFRELNKNSQK